MGYPNRDYPKVFNCPKVGAEAKKLFEEAQALLQEIIQTRQMKAKGTVTLLPANSEGDDILIYKDDERKEVIGTYHTLRQQQEKDDPEDPYYALSDFIAPKSSGLPDYIGGMAVGIFGTEAMVERFEKENDSYRVILVKAVADRLAESFAEALHLKIRTELWGYAKAEDLSAKAMHQLNYEGIRPAPGYPAQPDHTEKITMWKLGEIEERIGMKLTESQAMVPASAVSAIVFAHPKSKYFGLGKIFKDQVDSYAKRKNMPVEEVERILGANLGYN